MKSKPRILYLLNILKERTDEENPLSTNELIEILKNEYGISAYRTTISNDIEALAEFGIDIITIRSTQCRYFIGSREFELPELKLLIDAVESSKFITEKKSKTLTNKIYNLTSESQRTKLKRNNFVTGRIKPDNEQIYYIVDTINEAINEGKKISFQYYEYTASKEKVLKNNGEIYILSPYHFVWNDNCYYIIGYSEKHNRIVNFRVDRIAANPEILSEESVAMPEDFDLVEFTKSVFYMYGGKPVDAELRCDNSLMKTMIDRFGEDVTTLPYDKDSFRIIAEVSASPTFFGWIFEFGGKVEILGPEDLKKEYRKMVMKTARLLDMDY